MQQRKVDVNLFDKCMLCPNLFQLQARGRYVGIAVLKKDNKWPIVRSTTTFTKPAVEFPSFYVDFVSECKLPACNNAMTEVYSSAYRTMGMHQDQSQDLSNKSIICLYSCYNDQNTTNVRTLRVQNTTTKEVQDVPLAHLSLTMFSTDFNNEHTHQIILETDKLCSNTLWLGITFRLSKTWLEMTDAGVVLSASKKLLRIANQDEKRLLYLQKAKQNKQGTPYPDFDFTLSFSDVVPPIQSVGLV